MGELKRSRGIRTGPRDTQVGVSGHIVRVSQECNES